MINKLHHIQEFKNLLVDYRVSDAGKKILDSTKLVLFVGPSSSGRNTIINELLKTGKYRFIVSDTTRKPRKNNDILEQNGREYWFRTEKQMLQQLQDGLMLEAAVIHNQQVSGISIREIKEAADEQKIAINEIEVVGADNIYTAKPDTMFLFIVPPSVDEWLARMQSRGVLPPEETKRRLESAVDEIQTALNRDYYWFVVNETFMHTTRDIEAMISGRAIAPQAQRYGRAVAQTILQDIQEHLKVS